MPENKLSQLLSAITDGLRRHEIPRIADGVSGINLGSIGASGLRAASLGVRDADSSAAAQLRNAVEGTREIGREDLELPGSKRSGQDSHPPDQLDAPMIVAGELERIHLSGVQAKWESPSNSVSPSREFEAWILSPTEGPLPQLGSNSGFNCWEMLLWAGARRNVISHAQLREMYSPVVDFRRTGKGPIVMPMHPKLHPHGESRYTSGADLQPQRGDVIMWDGAAHVAMTTGHMAPDGSPEVYSFWPPPKHDFTVDRLTGSTATVTDAVQVTTISELDSILNSGSGTPKRIFFGRGPW
ncbi:hypothetical protein ACWIGW_39720 [Nocardia brasiliensis]